MFPPLPQKIRGSEISMTPASNAVAAAVVPGTWNRRHQGRLNLEGLSNREKDMVMGRKIYKTGLDVDTSVDEVIYNLIEVRNANRPDLPKLINPLKGGLAVVPPPDPNAPPKRAEVDHENTRGLRIFN